MSRSLGMTRKAFTKQLNGSQLQQQKLSLLWCCFDGNLQAEASSPGPETEPSKPSAGGGKRNKKSGCRCGNATLCPGKLTCCGQRCPCYVESQACRDCKCKGCRNPHRPGGGKVRPALPVNLQNMKVFYPATPSQPSTVVFKPVQSYPDKVVYTTKSVSSPKDGQKIIYPLRTFQSKSAKEQTKQVATIRMPVNLGRTINIKDLDLTKIPILASGSPPGVEPGPGYSKPSSSRIHSRSNSAQKWFISLLLDCDIILLF